MLARRHSLMGCVTARHLKRGQIGKGGGWGQEGEERKQVSGEGRVSKMNVFC